MAYKRIEDLNISECLYELQIDPTDAKIIVSSNDTLQKINQVISEKDEVDKSETKTLIINRLSDLLYNDKNAYLSCEQIGHFQEYLSNWSDGLWREEAEYGEKERQMYENNKNSVAGLKTYLTQYPNGRYVNPARSSLNVLQKKKKLTTSIIVTIVLLVIAILCYVNYHPVSYLDSVEDISCGKRGGSFSRTISTDAISDNLDLFESDNWIKINKEGHNLTIKIDTNHVASRGASISVCAYTTLFGIKLNEKEIRFNVEQASGVASFLTVNDSDDIHFNKFSSKTCSVSAITDGMNLNISTEGIDDDWIDVDYNIVEDGDNNTAEVRVQSQNNEGGEKEGYIVITSDSFSKRIRISQESGLASRFKVSTTYLVMDEEGTEDGTHYSVRIETDGTTWSVKDSPDWLNAEARVSSGLLSITLGPNSGATRYGTITLVSNNGHIIEIEVKQWGGPSNFTASPSTLKFGTSNDYEYVSIENDSRKSIHASSEASWITTSVQNKNRLKISCSSNSGSPRSGTVTVTCGGENLSITVKQKGWVSCNNCNGKGTISMPVTKRDIIGYFLGPIYGLPYTVYEDMSCPGCKDSEKRGYIVKDCE